MLTGAMWVEPDTNLTGGESLVRQLLHGKRYYKEVLEVESDVLWLPDTFGYCAALPQILAGFGVKYLVTQKIFWCCNDGGTFPLSLFYMGGNGRNEGGILPADQLYLPYGSGGDRKRVEEQEPEGGSEGVPVALWLWRRRRRPVQGSSGIYTQAAGSGREPQNENGLSEGIFSFHGRTGGDRGTPIQVNFISAPTEAPTLLRPK